MPPRARSTQIYETHNQALQTLEQALAKAQAAVADGDAALLENCKQELQEAARKHMDALRAAQAAAPTEAEGQELTAAEQEVLNQLQAAERLSWSGT